MDTERTNRPENVRDARTVMLSPVALVPKSLGPREAFFAAHHRLVALAEASVGPAVVVAAVDHRAKVVDAALVPARTALVIGRHSECRFKLTNAAVALRHLVLLAHTKNPSNGDGQTPEITHPASAAPDLPISVQVWDLDTDAPPRTEDDEQAGALTADGPVFLKMLEYGLWVIPASVLKKLPDNVKEAWSAMPPRTFIDKRTPVRPAPVARWHPTLRRENVPEPLCEVTSVTLRAAPLVFDDNVVEPPGDDWGMLRLKIEGNKVRHPVSPARLDRGVLIGRYSRCGIQLDVSDKLSRVHLLIVRVDGETWAIDTASTNGTKQREQPVSELVLASGDKIKLANFLSLKWTEPGTVAKLPLPSPSQRATGPIEDDGEDQ